MNSGGRCAPIKVKSNDGPPTTHEQISRGDPNPDSEALGNAHGFRNSLTTLAPAFFVNPRNLGVARRPSTIRPEHLLKVLLETTRKGSRPG